MSTETLPAQTPTRTTVATLAEHPADDRRGTRTELVGRHRELDDIAALLDGRSPHGPVLMLRGDAGIGKSALLAEAAARARAAGVRVLQVVGVECEAGLPFSGLHQLRRQLGEFMGRLAPGERDVLHRVFDEGQGTPPGRLAISTAALALFDAATAESRLLLLADDVHWLDRSSAEVLGFVAHRLEAGAVILAAACTGYVCHFAQARITVRDLEPLAPAEADRLLNTWRPALAPSVRRSLLEQAGGNPLALRELPSSLTSRQLSGSDPLPASLPLNERLQLLYTERVMSLPESASRTLLLAALEGSGNVGTVRSAAGADWDPEALAAAELTDLIRIEEGHITFRHPLIRSAVVQMAPLPMRRRAHRALAQCLAGDPDRRAWHLAEAAVEADEAVAAALEEAAERAARRGRGAAGVIALVRAAELSPDQGDRVRRLTMAAYAAAHTGRLDHAERLLADVWRARSPGSAPSRWARTTAAYLRLHREGDVDAAHALLLSAMRTTGGGAPGGGAGDAFDDREEALHTGLFTCYYGGRGDLWDAFDAVLRQDADRPAADMALYCSAFTDTSRQSGAVRSRIRAQLDELSQGREAWLVPRLGLAAMQIDSLDECRSRLKSALEHERDSGTLATSISCLLLLAVEARLSGSWAESESYAREGLALAEEADYRLYAGALRCQLLFLAAYRGDSDTAHGLARRISVWAGPRRVGLATTAVLHARALLALSQGDYEEAYGLASRAVPHGAPDPRVHYAAAIVMDLVEAAMRTGHTEEARTCAVAARDAGLALVSPRMALLTRAAEALAAGEGDQAGQIFADALADRSTSRWPFDRARVQLCYGGWLRRARNLSEARTQLRAALDTFEDLGAQTWAARAEGELRATGASLDGASDNEAVLTPQERQIALLAAKGMTNKQIGERLYLSHRTVGAHLYRVFPKLGISSRAALGQALGQSLGQALEHLAPADGDSVD